MALNPCVGYAEAISIFVNYANYKTYFGYSEATRGTLSINNIVGMMWASFGIMIVLAFYLDRVWPATVGVP